MGELVPANSGIRTNNVTIEGARILFRNFAGKEGQYNREGDRNFALLLPEDTAEDMLAAGWNVKYLKAREEGDSPQPYVPVAVKFGGVRPPAITMITSRGRTPLPEEMVEILDWADLANVDVIIRPYHWNVSGKTGTKAYLKTLFATIQEDELELKYADVPEIGTNALESRLEPLQITGSDEIVLDDEDYFEA